MTIYRIPTATSNKISDYVQSSVIDGREYILRFYWNQRQGTWFLDFFDQDNDPIVQGLALVLGADLLKYVKDSRKPPGKMFLVDLTGQHLQPHINELGSRVVLFYADQESVDALSL